MFQNIKNLFIIGVLTILCSPLFAARHKLLSPSEIKDLIDAGNVEQLQTYLVQFNNEDEKDVLDEIMKTKITPDRFSYSYGHEENFCQAPLHYAAATNQKEIVDMLLDLDPKYLELKDSWNNATPFWCAVFNGKLPMVDHLRLKGAKINSQDNEGYDPLLIAIEKGYHRTFDYLLKNGANFIYRTDNLYPTSIKITGDTSMFAFLRTSYVRSKKSQEEEFMMFYKIINKHIEDGKDFNIQDQYGRTPLMYAIAKQNPGYVAKLLGKGADMDIEDYDGNDACNYAVRYDNKQIESMVCVSRKIAGLDISDISRVENAFKGLFQTIGF